tara:strand:+ start:7968 stop:8849 length:882 start_codon:yes stop_codon:yes gene_type:complete
MSEETTNSGTVVETETTPTEPTEPALAEGTEADSGAKPKLDEYQQRVEDILNHHEKMREHQQQQQEEVEEKKVRSYEDVTLNEGESFDAIYDAQPPEVQRLLGSLRGDYTRKMQALSQERRKLEDLQNNLTSSEAFKALQAQAQAAAAQGQEFDPFDNKSMETYINNMVAAKLQAVLEPMYQEQMKAQSSRKVEDFMNEHPELKTDEELRTEVYEVLQANEHLDLAQGYWIVKGKRAKQLAQLEKQQQQQKREINRQVASRIGNGKKAGATAPPNASEMSGADIYQYLLAQKK